MTTEMLQAVLEAIQWLSTLIVFILLLVIAVHFFLSMTFSMDLLLILITFFGLRVMSRQQTVRRMGRSAGMRPLYTKRECNELFRIFLAGYRAEETALASHSPPDHA
jgi:uncharacterized membrane protein